jgi:NAD(P)-dependent dehydrogenase (short-subunit alcohol dehydrogenase family)
MIATFMPANQNSRIRDDRPVPRRLTRGHGHLAHLAGGVGHAEVLAATLILLASHASSYVTGITLPVEGGMLAT